MLRLSSPELRTTMQDEMESTTPYTMNRKLTKPPSNPPNSATAAAPVAAGARGRARRPPRPSRRAARRAICRSRTPSRRLTGAPSPAVAQPRRPASAARALLATTSLQAPHRDGRPTLAPSRERAHCFVCMATTLCV